jgi:hypothetical protein
VTWGKIASLGVAAAMAAGVAPAVAARQVNAIALVQDEAAVKATADPGTFLLDGVHGWFGRQAS